MDKRIKNVLPEITYEYDDYEALSDNVTYIFNVSSDDYKITYELDEFIHELDIELFYKNKLRECRDTNRVHLASNCNSTETPRGLVVNVDQKNAIRLEKELIVFALLHDAKWTLTKIDNNKTKIDKKAKQEEIFNSLFTIE
jgi:hypothetical protein